MLKDCRVWFLSVSVIAMRSELCWTLDGTVDVVVRGITVGTYIVTDV